MLYTVSVAKAHGRSVSVTSFRFFEEGFQLAASGRGVAGMVVGWAWLLLAEVCMYVCTWMVRRVLDVGGYVGIW